MVTRKCWSGHRRNPACVLRGSYITPMENENGLMIGIQRLDVWTRDWRWHARRSGPSSTWRLTGTLFSRSSVTPWESDEYHRHRDWPGHGGLYNRRGLRWVADEGTSEAMGRSATSGS